MYSRVVDRIRGRGYANLLVKVTGRALVHEGMIKMPLNLDPRQGTDWQAMNRG